MFKTMDLLYLQFCRFNLMFLIQFIYFDRKCDAFILWDKQKELHTAIILLKNVNINTISNLLRVERSLDRIMVYSICYAVLRNFVAAFYVVCEFIHSLIEYHFYYY